MNDALRIAKMVKPVARISANENAEAKNLAEKAKNHYGITHDIREAGYVLPDSSMLDFSGKHQVGDYEKIGNKFVVKPGKKDWMRGERNVDHREISDIMGGDGWESMVGFMHKAGAIRNKPGIGFESNRIPNDNQIKKIVSTHNSSYRGEPLMVELSHPHTGDILSSNDFHRPNVEIIKKWIDSESGKHPDLEPIQTFKRGGFVIHKSGGGNVEGYATKGAVTDSLKIAKAHPASIIHGIHVVGYNPIFHGDE